MNQLLLAYYRNLLRVGMFNLNMIYAKIKKSLYLCGVVGEGPRRY